MSDLVKIPEHKLSLTDDERDEIYAAGVSVSFMQNFVRNFLAERIAQQDAQIERLREGVRKAEKRELESAAESDELRATVETLKGLLREWIENKAQDSRNNIDLVRRTDQQLQGGESK